jgi:hypothetical protein
MNKIFKFLQISLVALAMMLILVSTLKVNVNAQGSSLKACDDLTYSKKITFTSLFNITNFLPLIPEECGVGEDKGVNPLPFYYIFDIIVRGAGLLFSIAFYLLPIGIITYGARVLFLPFDPTLNKNEFQEVTTIGRTITKELAQFLTGIIIILFSYTLVFTILSTLQISTTDDKEAPITTDLRSFFSSTGSN